MKWRPDFSLLVASFGTPSHIVTLGLECLLEKSGLLLYIHLYNITSRFRLGLSIPAEHQS